MSLLTAIPASLGFTKLYNFILYFIFGGALLGFTLARFMFLNINGIFCNPDSKVGSSLPGYCYFYERGIDRIGILLHLGTILPASFLVVFQFMPIVRHKFLLFHRISGYVIILLTIVSTTGVFMMLRHSFAGSIEMQTAGGLASILLLTCLSLGYYNVKKLQLEQHRAWMMRGWVMASFIITMRLIAFIMASIVSGDGTYYSTQPCYVVDYMLSRNKTAVLESYPACDQFYSGSNKQQVVPTLADMADAPVGIAAAFNVSFGAAGWLALVIHSIAVELYLHLTPAEAERLRKVSYQRQLEKGMKQPGNEGLTAQRVGYADDWSPKTAKM